MSKKAGKNMLFRSLANLGLALVIGGASTVAAQEDPFGGRPALTAPATGAETADAARPRRGLVAVEQQDLIVEMMRESDPKTPSELVRAISIMVDLDQIEQAKEYLTKLMALTLDDQTMFELNMEFGSDTFLRLRRQEELLPSIAVFARRLFTACDRYVREPDRLVQFISQINDGDGIKRRAALAGLLMAREDAVQPLMVALLDDSRRDVHPQLAAALISLDNVALDPLLAIAKSKDEPSFIKSIQVLSAAKHRQALPVLLSAFLLSEDGSAMQAFALNMIERLSGSRPSKRVAVQFLENYFTRLQEQAEIAAAQLEVALVWNWNPADQTLAHSQQPAGLVKLRESVEIARALHQYSSDNLGDKLRFWMSRLEYEKLAAEPSLPLSADRFQDADPRFLETVLIESLKADRVEAAIGAVELLAALGDEEFLLAEGGQPSPAAKALSHKNPRLRFAAAKAIMAWNPTTAYAGSSLFLRTLALRVGTTGLEHVLVIEPNAAVAESLAGSMNKIGFRADASYTAQRFLRQAVSHPDYAFAVVTGSVNTPDALEVVQRLRRDPRSASLPVALLGNREQIERLKEYAETDPLTKAFPMSVSADALQFIKEEMAELEGRDFLPQAIKIQQASAALDGLLAIARQKAAYPFYDLLQHEAMFAQAVYLPELSAKAVELLGWLATSSAQRELVGLASETNMPIEIRRAAVQAFANAVKLRGTLLTKPEIRLCYDSYNASEFLDKETQEVLASILDIMEARVLTSAKTE